jgi:hypothetical protein
VDHITTVDKGILGTIAKELRMSGRNDIAEGIEKAMERNEAVSFDVQRTVGGRLSTIRASSGGTFSTEDFRGDLKGWENVSKSLNTVRIGTDEQSLDIRKNVTDHIDVRKEGGTEVTLVTADGVKTGYMTYDPDQRQPVFVSGNERYGIERSIIRYKPEEESADGKVSTPPGYVLESVTIDPKTGKVVAGKTASIHITEGQVRFSEKDYSATIFTDTRTGNRLAVDGKTGRYWTRTYNQDSWTVHRDIKVSGDVFASVVTKHFGDKAGQYVSDFMHGLQEAGGIASRLREFRPGHQENASPSVPIAPKPVLYDAHGRKVN